MFRKHTDLNATSLKMAIDKLFCEMSEYPSDSPEYLSRREQVQELYALRKVDSEVNTSRNAHRTALIAIGANLAGVLIIVGYEQAHVLTTKALDRVKNPAN